MVETTFIMIFARFFIQFSINMVIYNYYLNNIKKEVKTIKITISAKIKINPTFEQITLLKDTINAYTKGCNYVSHKVFETRNLNQLSLHKETYSELREHFKLRSQMAQSVRKTVITQYKSAVTNGHDWSLATFKKPVYDLVWNSDYSLVNGLFSVNTLVGRIKIPFEPKGMEQYFEGRWSFGTAKLVNKHRKFFLHIPMTREIDESTQDQIQQVVGVDFGINFIATAYDSQKKTTFFQRSPY